MLRMANNLKLNGYENGIRVLVLLDFSVPFDNVDHAKLISRLEKKMYWNIRTCA